MTIAELKEEIKNLPDDMLVGSTGHCGEFLQVLHTMIKKPTDIDTEIFRISIEEAGEDRI